MIRPMTRKDLAQVQALTRLGHPGWSKTRAWYLTDHRTLVAEEGGEIVGYTTYGITPERHAFGRDVVVHPDWRGKGIGGMLHGARLAEAKERGATHFVGQTPDANEPMRRILLAWGGLPTVANQDGRAYVNGLEGA